MRNVILIKLRSHTDLITPITVPLGIGYLLKALNGINGIGTVFIDQHRDNIDDDELINRIKKLHPLIVGMQVFSIDYLHLCRLTRKIRRICPEAKIVAGGHHVTALPEQVLIDNPDLDFVVQGEGEDALRLLTISILQGSLDSTIKDIPNLVYRTDNGVLINKTELVDINKYGAPVWEMLEPNKYPPFQLGRIHKTTRVVPILTSRGCPYSCTFCAAHLTFGKSTRTRDVNNIVDEIEFLQYSYGFKEFIVYDDNFTFYKDHVINLSNELKKRNVKCYFSFPNGIRADKLDDEIIYHLKQMGTYMVALGIESGSKRTLQTMKKNWDLQMIKDKIHLLKKNGIIVSGSFILGFYDETMEDIEKTVNFAIKSGIDRAYFANYIPLPGTENFDRMIREGELKLEEIDWSKYTASYDRPFYHPRNISERDLIKAIRWATVRFYCRPKTLFNLFKSLSSPIYLISLILRLISLFKKTGRKRVLYFLLQ